MKESYGKGLCMQTIQLSNKKQIPQVGFGVFMINDHALCKQSIKAAFDLGFRHIDTAQIYGNEAAVGEAIQESGIPREEIYLTTKIWPSNYGYEKTKDSLKRSLARLKVDSIDLVLLHRPFEDYVGAWKALEDAVAEGTITSIGLSNFTIAQTDKIISTCKILPAINQVECHPYEQQQELRSHLNRFGIQMEAWYPIGHGSKELIMDPLFTRLGQKYNKSNVQIILRWHLQMNNIIFPKSTNPSHMKSNLDIFDFSLTDAEMEEIKQLDRKEPFFKQPDWLMKLLVKLNKFQKI